MRPPSASNDMPCGTVLVLEAATSAGSVALLRRNVTARAWEVLASAEVAMGSGSTDVLTPAVSSVCEASHVPLSALDAVVCGSGPGSFTSLRIVSALAKGLAFGLQIPLYAVPSLLLAISEGTEAVPAAGAVVVALDALRDECFAQRVLVGHDGLRRIDGALHRLPRAEVAAWAGEARLLEVAPSLGVRPHATAARWVAPWSAFGPQSVDRWEPEYGRLAEAQVKWEALHGRPLPAA